MKNFLKNTILILFIGLLVTVQAPYSFAAVGELNTTFTTNSGTGLSDRVQDLAIQDDGKIVVVGDLTQINGTTSNYIARLNSDGTPDTTFTTNIGTGFDDYTTSVGVQSDGKIVVVGGFTEINGTTSNYIARLNSDGTPDTDFITNIGDGFNSNNYIVVIQDDDKILVGGSFTTIDGNTSQKISRLNSDGTPDTSFNSNINTSFNGNINAIEIQDDGKIVVGGEFTSTSTYIARLNSDGTLDTTFNTNTGDGYDDYVYSLGIQSDGKIIVGGYYSELDGNSINNLSRLNSDGTPDTDFIDNLGVSTIDEEVETIFIQSNDSILLGGYFTNAIYRLDSDGTPDSDFLTNIGDSFNSSVWSIKTTSSGSILVGGGFTSFDGTSVGHIALLYGDLTTPTVSTTSSSSVTTTTATLTGNITATGGESNTERGFNYGLTTSYGSTTNETGTYSSGSFSLNITGLTCATTYHYRAYSTNSAGTGTGSDSTFTTSDCPVSGTVPLFILQAMNQQNQQNTTTPVNNQPTDNQTEVCKPGDLYNTLTGQKCNSNTNTFNFTKNLYYGLRNNDVLELQKYLNTHGFILTNTGPGSPGNETNYFGSLTKKAVIAFQKANQLNPDGIVGPITRSVMNGI